MSKGSETSKSHSHRMQYTAILIGEFSEIYSFR